MIEDKSIKNNIFMRRRVLGISQLEMAQRLGLERNTYGNIEKGRTRILNRHLPKIARELGVVQEELLLGYRPGDPASDPALHDVEARYGAKYQSIIADYERQLDELKAENTRQTRRISELEAALQDKSDLIAFQKEKIDTFAKKEDEDGNPE